MKQEIMRTFVCLGVAAFVTGCNTATTPNLPSQNTVQMDTKNRSLADYQEAALKFNSLIRVPDFETSPEALQQSLKSTLATANQALDQIGQLKPTEVDFTNTVLALDNLRYEVTTLANRIYLIKETSTNAQLREAATEQIKLVNDWGVGIDYREDVYRSIKAYSATPPKLKGEDAKLLKETMRDYRRAGLDLPKDKRNEVEALRKKLARLETDFESNVTQASEKVPFTKADLDGVPEDFLAQVKTGDDQYTIQANVTWQFIAVMENAKSEAVRLKLETIRDNLARKENVPLLQEILILRNQIAGKLGYKTWADYQIEPKMAKDAATAIAFEEKLKAGLQPKFDRELAEFKAIKVQETGDPNAKIQLWDWRYYANQLKKQKYTVDEEALKVYFPYQNVLDGMFAIYQKIFGLKFEQIQAPYKWVDDLQLYAVSDAKTGEPLGLFYLDMFPREGKYNHFAQFGIIEGKLLKNGKYQRPTVGLVCNFPPPAKDKPSLLSHQDVETLFHEFGHAMHSVLTRAKHSRFAGTSVPRDFVEAPSQMLENWVWDKSVLDTFAADYRDPSKKIPKEILSKLKEAKLATFGTFYRRQLSFGLVDLALHTKITETNADQAVPLSNKIAEEVFLAEPPDTSFVTYFGHLMNGYDAGYYGYAWAAAIAADMATVFEKSPKGYFDTTAGRRLRKEIYEPGDSRDVNVSIEKFLGRPRSIEPFLKAIGAEEKCRES